jgi:hypothetical protein
MCGIRTSTWRLRLLTALSLAIAAALGVLCVRHFALGKQDEISWRLSESRYFLRADRARIVMRGAPPAGGESARAAQLIGQVSNDDVHWHLNIRTHYPVGRDPTGRRSLTSRKPEGGYTIIGCRPQMGPLLMGPRDPRRTRPEILALGRLADADITRPLLAALEDPERFAAAHVIFQYRHLSTFNGSSHQSSEKELLVDWGGLRATLTTPRVQPDPDGFPLMETECHGEDQVRIDPAQLPSLRRLWHDRLGVEVATVPAWTVVVAAVLLVLLPAFTWFWRWRWRSTAAHGNLCVKCGYDVRESPGRCPECGALVPNHDRATIALPL